MRKDPKKRWVGSSEWKTSSPQPERLLVYAKHMAASIACADANRKRVEDCLIQIKK